MPPQTKQSKLIGGHPGGSNIFGRWLKSEDKTNGRHRELTELPQFNENDVIEWMANRLVVHHYDDARIERLKRKYGELGFSEYAEGIRNLPRADKTKKGNGTEALLLEYVESSLGRNLAKVFRLRYSPNADQSMKGDDVLMVDLPAEADKAKIYLGEAKFRKTPTGAVVNQVIEALGKDKMPLSWPFLTSRIQAENPQLFEQLDNLIVQQIKNRGNMIYVGLLLSDATVSPFVEREIVNNDNPSLVFVSMGINNPESLIQRAFVRAEELLSHPTTIGL